MIAALALLPENGMRLGLENLKEIADEMPLRTILLLEYVERVYVGSEGSPTRFPLSTWNVHLQNLRRDQGTIKVCERRNNKFVRLIEHSHTTTWNCIAALQENEICFFRTIIQFKIGEEEPRQNSAAYSIVDARLQHLCMHALCVNKISLYSNCL